MQATSFANSNWHCCYVRSADILHSSLHLTCHVGFKADVQSAYTWRRAAVCSAHKALGWYAGGVRLFVVVDTSVLLSHWSFIQALHRNLGEDGAVAAEQAGTPGVQVLLVVPWAVLVELDKLKAEHSVLRIPGLSCLPTCSGWAPAHMLTAHEDYGTPDYSKGSAG